MAKDASFDIVSQVDAQEVDNAVNQTLKEIGNRYDFKGAKTEINVDGDVIHLNADDDMRMKSVVDVLQSKFIRRGVPIENMVYGKVEPSGGRVKQDITIRQGIEKDLAKKISKDIRDTKLKVQTQIMDDKIRVSGKKIDDLQTVIGFLKEKDYGQALQYDNFRS